MKKIAHICTSNLSHKILNDKLMLLQQKGYIIDIVSSNDVKNLNIIDESVLRVKYIDIAREINFFKDIKSIINLYKLFKFEKYDIVHTHTAKAGITGRIAAKLAGVKLIVHTSHGLPFFKGQSKLKYNLYKNIERIGLKFCHLFGSQNMEDLSVMAEITDSKKLFYEGNGIDEVKLQKIYDSIGYKELQDLRNELNISNEDKILFMGARFEKIKNHKMLIDVLLEIKKIGENKFTCLLLGEGELKDEIKSYINEKKLDSEIKIIGFRKDVYKFMKLADIVILTSKKEGLPRIIMESMYFKKPIIATNVLGTKELVVSKETGLLSEVDNIDDMKNNLEYLMKNENLMYEYGTKGRQRIIKYFTEKKVVERIDCVYKEYFKNNKLQ